MMDDSRINILQNDKISTAIRKMSTPAIIGLLIMALYNFVDAMFVAWISTEATSATQVVFPIMIIASAIGLMFGMGAGAYISRLLGMNDIEKANVVSSTSFFTALVIGILFMILNYAFSTQIYTFFGANEEIMALTKAYGNYIVLGYTFSILNMVFNNQLRAEGSAKISMIGMIFTPVQWAVFIPLAFLAYGTGVARPILTSQMTNTVEKNEYATVLGISNGLGSISRIISPILGGLFLVYYNSNYIMILSTLLYSIIIVLFYKRDKYIKELESQPSEDT